MANCCPTFSGNIDENCATKMSRGGLINKIYVATYCHVDEISSTTNTKAIDTITMNIDPLTTNAYFWYQIAFKTGTGSFTNELQVGDNTFVNQSVTFTVSGISTDILAFLERMATGKAIVIVEDAAKTKYVLGRLSGLEASATSLTSGAAVTDVRGAVITLTGSEIEYSNTIVAGTTIEVFNGVSTDVVTL